MPVSRLLPAFCTIYGWAGGEDSPPLIRYNAHSHVFRIDAAGITYLFGVNENGEIQSLYWGQRVGADDPFPSPCSLPGHASFDPSVNATPQEFVAWGDGLYVCPDLKITFPDGNRDLVLRYVSHTIHGRHAGYRPQGHLARCVCNFALQGRRATGILCRSAVIENKTQEPLTVEEASSATWNLPQAADYQYGYLTG